MADEVFSGGVSVTGVEPGATTIAIKSTTNPNISKKVPVTVKSRNLLAYGPASGNGLTVTVAQDGSLDFSSGTESVPLNKGVRWKFDVPEDIVGVPLIISYTGNVPGSLIIGIYANANSLGGVYQGKNNIVVTIPKGTTRVELRILRGGVMAGSVSGNLKIQLELGNTAHEWMKPDVTSLEGVFLCFCQLLGELTCRDSGWLSWARFALPVASGVLSRVARFRLRGLVPGRGFRF